MTPLLQRPFAHLAATLSIAILTLLAAGCGKSYKDSPPTNPVQTDKVIDIVRYRPIEDETEVVIRRRQSNGFIALFDDSQEEPNPKGWKVAGMVTFQDEAGTNTMLQLYRTPDGIPDGYQNGQTYYVKEDLLASLASWVADRDKPQPPRR